MGKFFDSLLDLLFPPRCIFCRSFLNRHERHWCSDCSDNLPFTNGIRVYGDFFEYAVAPLFYRDLVRQSINRFKFRGKVGYARGFGKLLAGCIKEEIGNVYDVITWVPVSSQRKKTRGYDQSMLIAQAAALDLEDVAVEILQKPVDNPAQSSISDDDARRINVQGVFSVRDPELIQDRHVLLIDDIVTSGSTLSSCAKVLLDSGAKSVICVTLANATGDRQSSDI